MATSAQSPAIVQKWIWVRSDSDPKGRILRILQRNLRKGCVQLIYLEKKDGLDCYQVAGSESNIFILTKGIEDCKKHLALDHVGIGDSPLSSSDNGSNKPQKVVRIDLHCYYNIIPDSQGVDDIISAMKKKPPYNNDAEDYEFQINFYGEQPQWHFITKKYAGDSANTSELPNVDIKVNATGQNLWPKTDDELTDDVIDVLKDCSWSKTHSIQKM